MTERASQITSIFHSAIEREPHERKPYLDGACGGDEALRHEVEGLIKSHESAGSFIDSPAYERGAELLEGQAGALAGRSLGQYRLLSLLGAGGMGEVYLAEDTRLDRRVAIKVLPAYFTKDQAQVGRFQQEARAASALNHPNIVTIYEINEAAGTHYIATEYIEGVTLRTWLARGGVTLSEAVDAAVQIASALNAAHSAGVVHRDIKPENVMLRPDGYLKVLDFGIAKLMEGQEPDPDSVVASRALVQTGKGVVMGTAHYMSPEQARGLAVDARTDIWSLGVVLHELVTGRVPFAGATASDSIASILRNEPLPLTAVAPEAPLRLEWIVQKALRKDRDERYQTVKELLSDLRAVKQEVEASAQAERFLLPGSSANAEAPEGVRAASGQQAATGMGSESAAGPATTSAATHTTSSAEYIIEGVKRNKKIIFAAFALIVFAGVAFAIYQYVLKPKPAPAHFERVKLTRITTEGNLQSVAVAPDGKYIAYTLLADGKYSLWTKHLATGRSVQIVAPAAAKLSPHFFSHDGGYVFYYQQDEQNPQGGFFQVAVLGGDSKRILTNVQTTVALSPDGKQLAFGRYHPGVSEQYELWLANADGTNDRRLRAFSEPDFFAGYGMAWSPDAKLIACEYVTGEGGTHATVAAVAVADGTFKVITPQRWDKVGRIAWFGDGSGMAVVAREAPTDDLQIWHVSYPEGRARRITNDLNSYSLFSLTLTADSHTLVALQVETTGNIWVAPHGDAQRARAVTVLRKNVLDHGGVWTPDNRVLFASNVGGGVRAWVMNADGTGQKPLTEVGEYDYLSSDRGPHGVPEVSPDGRYIFFMSLRSKTRQLLRKDIDGSHPKQLTEGTGVSHYSLTPDGSWVLYNLYTPGIWKVSVDGGTPTKVSDASAYGEEVSPDGKLLAYYTLDAQTQRQRLVVVRFDDGAPVKTLDLPVTASGVWHWSLDARAFVYVDTKGSVSNLWRLPLDGARPAQITDFKSDIIRYFSYSRDGHPLVLARGNTTRDAVLITDEK